MSCAVIASRRDVAACSSRSDSRRIFSAASRAESTCWPASSRAALRCGLGLGLRLGERAVGLGVDGRLTLLRAGDRLLVGLHLDGELLGGLVAALGEGLLEVGGGGGGAGALVLVDRLGLLAAGRGLTVGVVEDLVGLALGCLEDAGRLGVGLAGDVGGVAVGGVRVACSAAACASATSFSASAFAFATQVVGLVLGELQHLADAGAQVGVGRDGGGVLLLLLEGGKTRPVRRSPAPRAGRPASAAW